MCESVQQKLGHTIVYGRPLLIIIVSGLYFTVRTVHIRSREKCVGTFDLLRIFAQAVKDSSEEVVFRWTCVLKPNLFSSKKPRHNLSSYFFLKA